MMSSLGVFFNITSLYLTCNDVLMWLFMGTLYLYKYL